MEWHNSLVIDLQLLQYFLSYSKNITWAQSSHDLHDPLTHHGVGGDPNEIRLTA